MANPLDALDWRLIQVFLAVARDGSLSAAAARLGLSQPTVGRQVAALEAALGLALFRRHPRGLVPTEAGQVLLAEAEAMAAGAARLSLAAAGRDGTLTGPVRITASVMVARHWLPGLMAAFRAEEPGIEIEIVPNDAPDNLLFREADIAIRMFEPDQPEVIARRLGSVPLGFFAARSYLDRRGRPATVAELFGHDLIGLDRSDLMLREMRARGWPARRESFAFRCDDQSVGWEMIRAGCGIGVGQVEMGRADPALEQLLPREPLPALPVWLTAPEALRSNPRIRRAYDFLARRLRPFLEARPDPDAAS